MRKFSKEELIQHLKNYYENEGHIPTKKSISDNKLYPSSATFINHFGSWNNALDAADLDIRFDVQNSFTDDELIELMTKFVTESNKKPTHKDINENAKLPHSTTFIRHFGSLKQALYIVDENIKKIEIEKTNKYALIEFLQDYYEENNNVPTINIINSNPKYPKIHEFEHYFGTWTNALKIAGFKTKNRYKTNYTNAELIEMLQSFGKTPSLREINMNEDMPHSDTFVKHFGSWNNALEKAGFEIKNEGKRYDADDMIINLKKFIDELGYYPSRKEVDKNPNLPSATSYANRFGSWRNVLEKVGYYD